MKPQGKKNSPFRYVGVLGIFLLSQLKLLGPLLKLGKGGGVIISMLASVWAYTLIYPIPVAAGCVVMILIHELGHVIAAKQKGLPVSATVFIPFVGALIMMRRNPTDAMTEAYIALGGPLLGTVGALGSLGLGVIFDSMVLISVAYIGLGINLFNLLPVHPLDGGRISTAVTRWLWLFGLTGGLFVIIYFKIYLSIFSIIWATFAYDLYKKYIQYRDGKQQSGVVSPVFEHHARHLLEQNYILPGESHQRELNYMTFSELDEGRRQTVEMYWEGIDFVARIQLTQQAIIKRVLVEKVVRENREDGLYLILTLRVEYAIFQNDDYYEVPTSTRWKFGIVYVLLALMLVATMIFMKKMELL